MSQRMRGQEVTLRVAVDGKPVAGSMVKVKDFKAMPRHDDVEEDYLGEDTTDLDYQFHGWTCTWSIDIQDAVAIDILQDIIAREREHRRHPDIVLTVIYTFREDGGGGEAGRQFTFHNNAILKQGDEGAGGRKDRLAVSYEMKCKTRDVLKR